MTSGKAFALRSLAAGLLAFVGIGCTTESVVTYEQGRVLDLKNPLIRVTREGLKFRDRPVTPEQAVQRLEALGLPKENDLHILVDDDYTDQRALWVFQHNYLHRAGYRHVILMHPQRTVVGTADEVSPVLKDGQKSRFTGQTITPGRGPQPQTKRFR